MLFQVTLFTDLIAMAATLWGAFYLLARGFPSRVTLRAVIVLLLLSIFFLGAYDNLFHQVAGTAAIRAALLILGLASWYSLTYRLMPKQSRERHRWMEIAIYVLGGVTALALLAIPDAFIDEQGNDLYVAHMRIGFPYFLYGTFQVVIVLGMLYNLLVDDRIGLTRQGKYFLVSSFFPGFAVASGVIGLALLPRLPRLLPDLLIFSGIFLLGISVARHQTLVERRTTIQDLPISFLTILGLAGIYAYLALHWEIPPERIGAIVAFAVLTHSAYDLGREFLERQRMRNESQFRKQLRQLESESSSEDALKAPLQNGLDLLCQTLHASGGFVAVRRGALFVVMASRSSVPIGSEMSASIVACEDVSHPQAAQLSSLAWIAPSFEGQTQVAVVGIEKSISRLEYSTGNLELLAEVADQIGTIVSVSNARPRPSELIRELVVESQANAIELNTAAGTMLDSISINPDLNFIKMVEDALRHLPDTITLGRSGLAEKLFLRGNSHIERGKHLQELLTDSIESLKPSETRPPEPLPRAWYNYVVLHDPYVEGVQNREIMARLYISEGTFNRTRRNAIRGLARLLAERTREPGERPHPE